MKTNSTVMNCCLVTVCVLLLQTLTAGAMAPPQHPVDPRPGLTLSPHPATWDQITQNVGNIVTTIDNYGYIGGYDYYNLPSGEWPRNSGHNYLAEIRYWMGGISPAGDTLVANTYDDFQAIPNPDFTDNPYKILLSTDTSRYYSYDPNDTVGQGEGKPAHGWRVWDAELTNWEYNEIYNSLASAYSPGGPTSLQDSHYRFGDAALGSSLMGLEVTQTVYQWNYCYNEDFLFVVLDVTNASAQDYTNFAFGLYIDIDVGGQDGTGENGRLGDLVAFDSTENLAWIYDADGKDDGWGPNVRTGIMGTKLLETPLGIGMTAFRTDDWAVLPDDDPGRYAMINSQQFDGSLPPTDQFYVQCTRGIDMPAGATVRVVYALVAGSDEADFRNNAQLVQDLYDNNFVGPEPPPTPILHARAADRKVYLTWTDTSEVGLDPMSGINDFVGYRLYRSENLGKTWGVADYNNTNQCIDVAYQPLSQWAVFAPGDPIPHSYIDTGLYNGAEYWYCLAAYDKGDSVIGVDSLQTGFGIAGATPNILSVTPKKKAAGYVDALSTVKHETLALGDVSEGTIYPWVFNQADVTGEDYSVVFEDAPEATYWHLINETTGDTVLDHQTIYDADPTSVEVVEGLKVVVEEGERSPRSAVQTGFAGSATTMEMGDWYGPGLPELGLPDYLFSNQPYRDTYEFRYTGDSSATQDLGSGAPMYAPLEVWNMERNERVSFAVYDLDGSGTWEPYDLVCIDDVPYDPSNNLFSVGFPYSYSWLFGFDPATYDPSVGDVFTVYGAPMNGPNDKFTFKIDGVDAGRAAGDLKNIKVVPNPYYVSNSWRAEQHDGETKLQFKGLPQQC
ncbi:MAG: hypothetical protein KKB37_17250, partial [Alphaproteobacteria bacterium]|nr:hypothetical protein [Alphaproteobacteria bacterium]